MLLNAILWLPTLFTYIVFLLILIILFFIVAYVSHKIYISIYDNLPLPAAPGSRSLLGLQELARNEQFENRASSRSIWIPRGSQIYESSVVRITITLEPCYLVSVNLDIFTSPGQRAISFMCNCKQSTMTCAALESRSDRDGINNIHILKYYEHLTMVPRLKVLLKCNERSNMRLVLDDVIKDVMEARCTEDSAACQPRVLRRLSE